MEEKKSPEREAADRERAQDPEERARREAVERVVEQSKDPNKKLETGTGRAPGQVPGQSAEREPPADPEKAAE